MNFLDDKERTRLRIQHKQERDGRIRDRIKAVLLYEISLDRFAFRFLTFKSAMESYILKTTEPTEITEREDSLTGAIIGAAIEVHKELGPGLLESAYEACLIYELRLKKLKVEHQKSLPIFYKDVMLDCGYRLDLVVENEVIVEIKSVNTILAIHEAQLLSYLKLSDYKRGLLINFNVKLLRDRRMKS